MHRALSATRRRVAVAAAAAVRGSTRAWHDVATVGRLGDPALPNDAPALLRAHHRLLHERPLLSAAAGATAAAAAGDALAQLAHVCGLEEWIDRLGASPTQDRRYRDASAVAAEIASRADAQVGAAPTELGPARAARFACAVGLLVGCGGELWYRRLRGPFPGWTYDVALRTIVDLGVFAPAALCGTIALTAFGATGDAAHALERVRDDAGQPLGLMWGWWGGGLSASYLLLPTLWQPPFALGLAVGWCAYVSSRLHRPRVRGVGTQRVPSYLREQRQLTKA
jgi:hypothetical protein